MELGRALHWQGIIIGVLNVSIDWDLEELIPVFVRLIEHFF